MIRFIVAAAASMLLGACAAQPAPSASAPASAPAPAAAMVELENPADGTRMAVKRGGELKLVLDGSPQTGMQWQSVASVAPVLSPIGQPVQVSKSPNPIDLTAGAWNIFRYRAEQPGTVEMQFALRRPGESGPAAKSVRYQVIVE